VTGRYALGLVLLTTVTRLPLPRHPFLVDERKPPELSSPSLVARLSAGSTFGPPPAGSPPTTPPAGS